VERKPWQQQDGESSKAHAAFLRYMRLPVESRSIDAAWRQSAVDKQNVSEKRAPPTWMQWSSKYNWVARATAHDAHLAQIEQERYDTLWAERRQKAKERDWAQADAIRNIVDESLPHADRFIRSSRTTIKGEDGQPDQIVITLGFDIAGLTKVLVDASKLQRLASDQSTANIGLLYGAALESAIIAGLAQLADPDETRLIETDSGEASAEDSATEAGRMAQEPE
jgi:hypothetical protein